MPPSADFDFGPTLRGLRAGTSVFGGRYTLERELGRGGMGVVWLAADGQLDRKVALKFLPDEVAKDDLALADLKRETKRCLELTHPHIVRVFDWHEENGLAAISMEFIDGASLSKLRLERENWVFTAEEIKPWLKSACEALEYAHTVAKVVHRDLKPANLMVTSSGMLKICDFGIARSLGESRSRLTGGRQSDSAGSPPYMSPQHLLGMPPKPTDDIYSLGATLYELFTGKPPFYTGSIERQIETIVPPSMMERRKDLVIERAEPIPAEWEAMVAACLEKDPTRRPQSVMEVWKSLNAVTGEKPPDKKPKNRPTEKSQNGPDKAGIGSLRKRVVLGFPIILAAVVVFLWADVERKNSVRRANLAFEEAASRARIAETAKRTETMPQQAASETANSAEISETAKRTQTMALQAVTKAKKMQAMVLATSLASAVQQFYMEYSQNPTLDEASAGNVLSNDSAFIAQLAGQTKENPRGIDFMSGIPEAKGSPPANGLLRQNGKLQVLDPWGMPFHIAIDHDYDGETATPDGSDGGKIQNKVLVLSCGPDKTLKGKNPEGGDATQDNVKSW